MSDVNAGINPVQARTHALNIEGIFLQQRVAHILRQVGWTVTAEEYSIAFPPGNGPILGKEGRLDIRAEKGFSTFRTVLAVECKKADSGYKDWVFFPKGEAQVKAAVVIRKVKDGADQSATGRDRWDIPSAITPFTTGLICQDARELKAEYGKPDSWKSATERIEKACYQAAQATQALAAEIGDRQGLLLNARMEPEITTWVIPMVVTTASLLLCRFDPRHVSLDTGEIDWTQVSYDSVDAVALEYPLPVHLQMRPMEPLRLGPEDVNTFRKKHVFIVKSTGLERFLQRADLGAPLA